MIKTCCELPKCMLDFEKALNDYDFVLYHQYLKDDKYRNHYLKTRVSDPERIMILDNSAYEFFVSGEKFVKDDFIRVIKELKPDYYIVPDVLMDKDKTLENFFEWLPIIDTIDCSVPYFVPQGRLVDEFVTCITKMYIEIDRLNKEGHVIEKRFCIPFHNDFFRDEICDYKRFSRFIRPDIKEEKDITVDERYAIGRMTLMDEMVRRFSDCKFHMLGSHNPREIRMYANMPEIESIDTGYPVKLAIEGVRYGEETSKPNIIIDDFYNQKLDHQIQALIADNIAKMKVAKTGYPKSVII